jgi:hypothetical protein
MEIDLSKILLLVLAVLPGFFALRARKSIVRSLHNRGATEELAEFLVYSVLVHLALAMFLLVVLAAAGFALKFDPFFFLRSWLLLPIPGAARRLLQLPAYVPLIYLLFLLRVAGGWALRGVCSPFGVPWQRWRAGCGSERVPG